jgi:hypothetical protein
MYCEDSVFYGFYALKFSLQLNHIECIIKIRSSLLLKSLPSSMSNETDTKGYRDSFLDIDELQVQAADSLLKLVSDLKQTAIFSGFASLNDHVEL